MYHLYSEHELLLALKHGDDRAFAEVYERYWEPLFKQALSMTHDEDMAKDIVQDSFVCLWEKISHTEITKSLRSYLFIAVRSRVLNQFAHGKVQAKYLESLASYLTEGENQTDLPLQEKVLQEQIDRQIASLPERMRTIFEMSRKEYMSYKEIADELYLSDKTVKKQISRALKILRVKLDFLLSLTIVLFFF
ncbi:RNA polymerase sigma-70 factor [Parapedobacter sp. SGR-10]|uniref:RNA polymerase sigma factor n=1 Tax=Parapedobacter sp. SGR-10 TaxID=2710879 RepID=UPI0013D1661C|nr:RNA polymerase sigma-70 factor [Parapedobacter sp. SGR-10]NGF56352.1 RNA polymerase sigma-70 factor [Parapedobacter sp. SGR-10]